MRREQALNQVRDKYREFDEDSTYFVMCIYEDNRNRLILELDRFDRGGMKPSWELMIDFITSGGNISELSIHLDLSEELERKLLKALSVNDKIERLSLSNLWKDFKGVGEMLNKNKSIKYLNFVHIKQRDDGLNETFNKQLLKPMIEALRNKTSLEFSYTK